MGWIVVECVGDLVGSVECSYIVGGRPEVEALTNTLAPGVVVLESLQRQPTPLKVVASQILSGVAGRSTAVPQR
jgi:hypothetical protein